jgi:hypothetical protein
LLTLFLKLVITDSENIKVRTPLSKRACFLKNIAGNSEEHKNATTLLAISLPLCAF